MEEKNNQKENKGEGKRSFYNLVEFFSIILIIILHNILTFIVGVDFYLITAIISFIVIYVPKFFIDRRLNFHDKWENYVEDYYFYVLYGIIVLGTGILYVAVQYVLDYDILYTILAGGVSITFKKIVDQEYDLFFKER
ncbi:MAG: hypothetical protein EU549_01945, partial [Promethearchaeota archaeon]